MAHRDVVGIDFEKDPIGLLDELGLTTKTFQNVKQKIMTRILGCPELQMIVLEFRRGEGFYYGEIRYGQRDDYKQAQKQWSEASGRAAWGDQSGSEESTASGDDGIPDGQADHSGGVLERLLRGTIAR